MKRNTIYWPNKPIGLKLLTRLRLGLNRLNEHRFDHNSENCLNPLSTCILEADTTSFLAFHYHHFIRLTLFNEIFEIDMNFTNLSEEKFLNIVSYGSSLFSDKQNRSVIKYITDSNRFSGSIF